MVLKKKKFVSHCSDLEMDLLPNIGNTGRILKNIKK